MIEQVMFFALGALTPALLTIALLPALWRRAVRLTRARLEATLPLTPGEIAAEKDQLRAVHSVDIRRIETQLEAADAALQAAKTDIGAKTTIIQVHEATITSQNTAIAALRADGDDKRERIAALEQTIATLEQERDNLATNLSASRMTNQALSQDALNLRQTSDQKQARLLELDAQTDSLTARLADSVNVATRLRDEVQAKNDELRLAARKLREAATHIATLDRKIAAAETMAADTQHTIDDLQAERLQLIEENGRLGRERDHEHIERQTLRTQIESLNRRYSEALGEASPDSAQDVVRDLTRTIDGLRRDRRHAEDELSSLRLEKTVVDAEILRLRRMMQTPDATLPEPPVKKRGTTTQPQPDTSGQG